MSEDAAVLEDAEEDAGQESGARQRSTIAFPYADFGAVEAAVHSIHKNVGHGSCSLPQLAAWVNFSPKSSGLRTLISAARLFGVIESDGSEGNRLSQLGIRVVDPAQARAAKAEAFLRVPLFSALFQKYEAGLTPPSIALEAEIVGLGVSEKQKKRARQVFESSARQTGFREHGPNRLVAPPVNVPAPAGANARDEGGVDDGGRRDSAKNSRGEGAVALDLDPLLIALLQKIPPQGQQWPADRRMRWFKTFAMNVSEVYDADGEPVEMKITLSTSTANSPGNES
jgi:hypothetical protein